MFQTDLSARRSAGQTRPKPPETALSGSSGARGRAGAGRHEFSDRNYPIRKGLCTELRVASRVQNLDAFADDWLAANIKRGWVAASSFRRPEEGPAENTADATPIEREPTAATTDHDDPVVPEPSTSSGPRLTITFARSSSPTFPLVRRRLDTLAPLGALTVNTLHT